jgi:hypothetical protein
MSEEERRILESLDAALRQDGLRARIDARLQRAEEKLARHSAALLAWEPLPLDWYGSAPPSVIRSSWVFVLRAGTVSGAERHPNSHQRMMSYRGAGDLQVWCSDRWHSNPLASDPGARFEKRWVSIPPNVWHQAVVPAGKDHWAVVSFHTAVEKELIEEQPDPADSRFTRQRRYTEMEKGAR